MTNLLGSSLTKSGLLLGLKSYPVKMALSSISFLNIPLSYISELFMGGGGVWVWTPFLLTWSHFGKRILTLFEYIKFSCNFHKIHAEFSKTVLIISYLTEKLWKFFSHKIYRKSFLPKLFGKFFFDFQFHLESFKIDRNAQRKFSDEISTKFKMSRLLKIILMDSLIFIITSNKEMLVVFKQFIIINS